MSVDFIIEDVSLDKTLLECRQAYTDAFRAIVHPYLPSGRKWRAFEEHYSGYVDYEYWGVEEETVTPDEMPKAGELVGEFELLLKAVSALKPDDLNGLNEIQKRGLYVFRTERLKDLLNHCRKHPNSRIMVIIN